jgi:hypothetical protein
MTRFLQCFFIIVFIALIGLFADPISALIKSQNTKTELEIKKLQLEIKIIEEQVIPVSVE